MRSIGLGLCFGLIVGCGADGPAAPQDIPLEVGMSGEALHVGGDPVGLSLFFRDGTHEPLRLTKGHPRYLQEVDIVERVQTTEDLGIEPLFTAPATQSLDWTGVTLVEEQWIPSLDGTFTRERYYRNAKWMERKSSFTLVPRDAQGHTVGSPLHFAVGRDNAWRPSNDAFVRRFSARQLALGCTQVNDCSGAAYVAETLVQARDATRIQQRARPIDPRAVSFTLLWSAQATATRSVAVEQTRRSEAPYAYGLDVALSEVSTPSNGAFYEPGENVTLQVTLRDGDGNRLHPEGSLPTFLEVFTGQEESGIRYLNPTLPTRLYYALKHRESNFMAGISGPLDQLQSPETIVDPSTFFLPQTQFAFADVDGYTSVIQTIPAAGLIFGGFQDPNLWQVPVSDTVTFVIPDDAQPGTYVAVVKARREFRGEALNRGASYRFQVGQVAATAFVPATKCGNCHGKPATSFANVLHGIDDRATCYTCHSSLAIEVDNRLDYRVHRVHALSDRYPGDVNTCGTCHITTPTGPALGL